MDKTTGKEFGFLAENIAARHLESKGYEVIERNYRRPWGEIDLIAKSDDVVVFVEVKANSRGFAGNFEPELRVDHRKVAKIARTAQLYLGDDPKASDIEWRVDVVSVTFDELAKKAKIKHFKNIAADPY